MKYRVMVAWFPYAHMIDDRAAAYVAALTPKLMRDSRIDTYALWSEADTPITMVRNRCLLDAEKWGADYVLMLDSDNIPDIHERDPGAKPFWESSFDFMLDMDGIRSDTNAKYGMSAYNGRPCVVAAPYVGPPPHECVYAFDWVNHSNNNCNPDFALEMVPRHEAAQRKGFMPAAALATGVMLIDMRAVKKMPHPRFYYEWKDSTASMKASTEDVTFTRDLTYMGIPIYCNWDAWAAHLKTKICNKPVNIPADWVPKHMREWAQQNVAMGHAPKSFEQPIRAVNTWDKLPTVYPPGLVRQTLAVEPESDAVPEPPAHLQAEMSAVERNGDVVHIAGVN